MYKNINDYEQLYLISENEDEKQVLYEKYRPIVLSIAERYHSLIRNKSDLEDFIQEGYIGIESAIKSFNEDEGVLFYTFCVICIERQIRSYYRKLTTKRNEVLNKAYSLELNIDDFALEDLIADTDFNSNPTNYIDDEEFYKKINDFKYSLEFKYSLVFELRINGFKYREISKLLDISLSTVENYMRFCKIKFKQCFI